MGQRYVLKVRIFIVRKVPVIGFRTDLAWNVSAAGGDDFQKIEPTRWASWQKTAQEAKKKSWNKKCESEKNARMRGSKERKQGQKAE